MRANVHYPNNAHTPTHTTPHAQLEPRAQRARHKPPSLLPPRAALRHACTCSVSRHAGLRRPCGPQAHTRARARVGHTQTPAHTHTQGERRERGERHAATHVPVRCNKSRCKPANSALSISASAIVGPDRSVRSRHPMQQRARSRPRARPPPSTKCSIASVYVHAHAPRVAAALLLCARREDGERKNRSRPSFCPRRPCACASAPNVTFRVTPAVDEDGERVLTHTPTR